MIDHDHTTADQTIAREMGPKPIKKQKPSASKARAVPADDAQASQATAQKRPALSPDKAAAPAATSAALATSSGDNIPKKKKPKRYASPLRETQPKGTTVPDVDLSKVSSPALELDFLREEGNITPIASPQSNMWADTAKEDRKIITNQMFGDDDSSSEIGRAHV